MEKVDPWFRNYGDNGWKNLAYECIKKMDIIPEEIRHEFEYVINWLRKEHVPENLDLELSFHGTLV